MAMLKDMNRIQTEMLEEHLPYRLTHLDGLCWACEVLISGENPSDVSITFDGVTKLKQTSVLFLTNSLVEAGLLYCRVLFNFLGIRLEGRLQQLTLITNPGSGDDFSIVKLGLPILTLDDLRLAPTGIPGEVEESCRLTLLAINKGVAHFTDSSTPRSQAQDALCCAKTVMWLTEEYVYKRMGLAAPFYKLWTKA
jgi:hypothetical protein